MPISVSCPSCGHEYNVKDEAAGKKFKCKECEAIVEVPDGDSHTDDSLAAQHDDADDPFSNLDFGSPAPAAAPAPQRRSSSQRAVDPSSTLDRLAGPAVGMMVTAGIGMLFTLGLGALMIFALLAAPGGQQEGAIVGIAINGVALMFGMVMLILVMYGAFKMKNGESYGLAMAASIIAAVPCLAPCICMPFGIWGIVVLVDDDVKSAFR